jgi:hypothetical protein
MAMRIETTLRLENDSELKREGWWHWSVWLDGSDEDIDRVVSVVYRLHPTFPHPVVRVTTPETRFRLQSAGWGEFLIAADAAMKPGTEPASVHLERWLELEGAQSVNRGKTPSVFLSHSVADSDVADSLRNALRTEGIEVKTADESLDPGDELFPQIERQMRDTDAVVAIVSPPASHWVEQEAVAAHEKGRYVIPVVLRGARVDAVLSKMARFELTNASHVGGLARQIAARVKDFVTPE